jgi:hypothetical protein
MLRRNQLIVTAALALACSLPASAAVAQHQEMRNPDNRVAPAASERHVPPPGSSIAGQEGEGYPPGVFTAREREIVRDFERTPQYKRGLAQTQLERLEREAGTATLEVPSGGFDWGDAGIGAAGMLALFSIGAGSTLLVTSWRRRRSFQVTTP